MDYLYHGSSVAGITTLEPHSPLHNSDKRVVYLTGNIPYALIYIWDEKRTGYDRKYVTGWMKDGIANYEEQFPDQLELFYKNVSGYLYYIQNRINFQPVDDRESMFYNEGSVSVDHAVFIADVYEELLKHEKSGLFRILRYKEQSGKRQDELTDMIAKAILKNNFYQNDTVQADFMKRYHHKAWEKAFNAYQTTDSRLSDVTAI